MVFKVLSNTWDDLWFVLLRNFFCLRTEIHSEDHKNHFMACQWSQENQKPRTLSLSSHHQFCKNFTIFGQFCEIFLTANHQFGWTVSAPSWVATNQTWLLESRIESFWTNTFLPVERQSPPSHHSFEIRPSQIPGRSYSAVCHSSPLFTSQSSRWILASLYSCQGESVMQTLLFCSGHLRFPQPGSSSFLKQDVRGGVHPTLFMCFFV